MIWDPPGQTRPHLARMCRATRTNGLPCYAYPYGRAHLSYCFIHWCIWILSMTETPLIQRWISGQLKQRQGA